MTDRQANNNRSNFHQGDEYDAVSVFAEHKKRTVARNNTNILDEPMVSPCSLLHKKTYEEDSISSEYGKICIGGSRPVC